MDFTRSGLYCIALILFIKSFFVTFLWGGWNENYLNDSFLLIQTIDSFAESNNKYKDYLIKFQNFKSDIDSSVLSQELIQLEIESKRNFFTNEYVVKKRFNQNINESFFWEISIILSLNDYATPSFPIEKGNNLIIIQPFENFEVDSWITNLASYKTNKVTLREYFYAHILAFLLGAQDLSGANIGLTPYDKIRFFDNEDVFVFERIPCKTNLSFFVPFVSVAFDWSQYRQTLNETLAHELREFISSLKEKKNELWIYANIRGVSEKIISGICDRIDILNACEFQPGMAFVNFIQILYPQLSEGLDELNDIVGKIILRKIDHGIALFFATKMIQYWALNSHQKKALDSWIERYITKKPL